MLDEKYLTITELCELLKIGRNTAYSLCNDITFPSFRVGKKILIDREKLEIWLNREGKK